MDLLSFVIGLVVGAVVGYMVVLVRSREAGKATGKCELLEAQIKTANDDFNALRATLDTERQLRVRAETQRQETFHRLDEEKKLLDDAKLKLTDAFKALASDTLQMSNQEFLKLAKETFDKTLAEAKGDLGKRQEAIDGLVKPIGETLKQFEEHVRALESNRMKAYAGLEEQLKNVTLTQQQLQKETVNLVTALRAPQVRGRWGEMTLRRVVELAGMSDHCDFTEQVTVDADDRRSRPDMVIHLPGERDIVVDAKCSLDAYLDAVAADTEEKRSAALTRHAAQIRTHMKMLADKSYWTQFPNTPEFVVMFIPGESFFAAAVDADQQLLEDGLERRVVLATPTTLIALVRAVAYGWRQEQVAKNAQEISALGKELYGRMAKLCEYMAKVRDGLDKAVIAHNEAVGSIEARVLPAARKFKELGAATGEDLPNLTQIDVSLRSLNVPESQDSASA